MRLQFKTIGDCKKDEINFDIHVGTEETVKSLKDKIFDLRREYEHFVVERQVLIFKGIKMEDDKKLSDYGLKEDSFIVLMIKPLKPVLPACSSDPMDSQPGSGPVDESQLSSAQVVEAANTLLMGSELDRAVGGIVSMGFSHEEVIRAMTEAFNNPDLATEYLLNMRPNQDDDDLVEHMENFSVASNDSDSDLETGSSDASRGEESTQSQDDVTDSPEQADLASHPDFQEMRRMVQLNPASLSDSLRKIHQNNPQLFAIIEANEALVVEMLNRPPSPDPLNETVSFPGQHEYPQLQNGYVHITPEDNVVVQRLKLLGFPEEICLQAYFACDKDENLAANFLLNLDN